VKRTTRRKATPPGAKQPLQKSAYQALARILRLRAEELNLSIRDLAKRLDRPVTTVHKTLRGQRRLDPIEFLDWCQALNLDDPLDVIRSARSG
jgi:hypothetical protein